MTAQLPLRIRLHDHATFANFVPGANAEAAECLREGIAAGQCVYLWGAPGTGKTHLLQAACRTAAEGGAAVAYVPFAECSAVGPALLDGIEDRALVCLDDVEALAGDAAWERAVFNLFNLLREGGRRLLVAAAAPPPALGLALADLSTRLAWGLVFQLRPLGDRDKHALLQLRAARRGLEMPPEVADYLLARCPRDLPALLRLLERLDTAALAAQRRLTVPFVRSQLEQARP